MTPPEAGQPSQPYRGPEPFRFIDHPIFMAREEETRVLLQNITIYRGVLTYGDQGAGKSSLINAGVIPQVLARGLAVDRILVRPEVGREFVLDRVPLTEAGPPFVEPSLAREDEREARVAVSVSELERRIRTAAQSKTRLLIFDQFEEIVTNFGPSPEAISARESIVALLLRLFYERTLAIKLILVFREDYLAKISDLLAKAPDLTTQHFWLRPPEKERADDIIDGPFNPEKTPHPFQRGKFSPELIAKLANELKVQGESDRLSLTDLQISCLELWRSDDPARHLGELHVQGLLEAYLNRALDELAQQGLREPAIALLSFMVTPYGTRNVISEEDAISRVQAAEPFHSEKLREALKGLVQTRLVRREVQHNAAYYDIVSEYLAPWVAKTRRQRDAEIAHRSAREDLRAARNRLLGLGLAGTIILLALTAYIASRAQTAALRAQLEKTEQTLARVQAEKTRADQAVTVLSQANRRSVGQKGAAMFGSTTLDVAIGVALLYLLLSLVCSVLNELIAAFTEARARQLERGISELLGDAHFVKMFYSHPLVESLKVEGRLPSYIPAQTFAVTLSDIVAPDAPPDLSSIRARVLNVQDSRLSRALSSMLNQSATTEPFRQVQQFHQNIEAWFNNAMDAVAGAYRRRTQWMLLTLAIVITVGLNVDTLHVANRLSGDSALRASLVAQAQALAEARQPSSEQTLTEVRVSQLRQVVSDLQSLSIPIGWSSGDRTKGVLAWTSRLVGWAITALAVSLGAPFWFDLLSKFMVVRSTIKPRERSLEDDSTVRASRS